MLRIGLISNNNKKKAQEIAEGIHKYLRKKGSEVLLLKGDSMPEKYGFEGVLPKELSEASDYIISVGGDGTFLRAAGYSFKKQVPIMGVNVGKLGFLAEVSIDKKFEAIDRLVAKDFNIEERMLLEMDMIRKGVPYTINKEKVIALNEFTITRNMMGKIIDIEILINDLPFLNYRADGVIIATPTGSTAYSLSAGGPIVEPKSEVVIITPLCAHNLFSRSIVISPENDIKIKLKTKNKKDSFNVDGVTKDIEIRAGDILRIKKSAKKLKLITFEDNVFFRVFKEKLLK